MNTALSTMNGSAGALPNGYPFLVPALAVATAAGIMLCIGAARRRDAPLAVPFMLLMAAATEWCAASLFELVGLDPVHKLFWMKAQYLGMEAIPVLWVLLSARYSGRLDLSRPQWIVPLSLLPAASTVMAFLSKAAPASSAGLRLLRMVPGPWFWIATGYDYLLLFAGAVLFLSSLIASPAGYKRQAFAVALGVILPWIGNAFALLGINPGGMDATPFCFVAGGAFFSWALFRRRFLDIVPFARDAVVESLKDPFIVVSRDGRIADANPAALSLIGADTRSLIGASASRVFPLWDALVRSVRADKAVVDGFSFPAGGGTRRFEADITVLRDRRGRPTGKALVLHDFTGRRIQEDALRRSESKYRGLVESMGNVIFSLDADGRLTYISPVIAGMAGFTPAEIIGSHYSRFVVPDDLDFVARALEMCKRGIVGPMEFRLRDIRGSLKVIRADAFPLRENGKIAGLSGIMTDITGQRQLVEQLHQARKMEAVGRLAGGIAHDFNNLLTAINGFSEMIRTSAEGTDAAGWAEEIKKTVHRGSDLVTQLLTFSRKRTVSPRPLELNAVVSDMEKILSRILGKGISVVMRLSRESAVIVADQGQIGLVLINLAANARDAMPQGGTLTVETAVVDSDMRPGRRDALLRVSDTGYGMDEEVKNHLFEPFFTTKEPGKGTGLGLSTVYGIVKQSGGRISVSSAHGMGTSVEIRFQLRSYEAGASRAAASDRRSKA